MLFFDLFMPSSHDGSADAELRRAQLDALTKQVPVLYAVLIVNTLTLAWTHQSLAPVGLAIWAPGALCLACLARLALWWRDRGKRAPDARVAARLRATTALSALLGTLFAGWALSLYPYGGPSEQSHVAFYMSVTVLACYLCLTHLPAATLMLFVTGILPFSLFFGMAGNEVHAAMAFNMLVVALAMAFVVLRYYRDFVDLDRARQVLIERQRETQRLSDENFRLANVDSLTGLPNRRRFFADLHDMLAGCEQRGRQLAIGLIDLDGFKPVNDVYGHQAGDDLLALVAARLTPLCGERAMLARLGGDEFAVIFTDPRSRAEVEDLGHALIHALRAPFKLPRVRVRVSGSIGFAIYPAAARTAETLFEKADYALYHAKETKRGGAVIFSEEHERKIREAATVAQQLRTADFDEELRVVFQPVVDFKAGRTIGFEALARWRSPTLGDVSPEVFVPLAERYNMVNDLTRSLLRKMLRASRDLPEGLRISFNLSTFDLASPEAMERIVEILAEEKAGVERLDFEITETAVFVDFEQARAAVGMLKKLGARVSLDDFGRGYSSLAYVQKLPLDRIKIDRGFIAEIESDRASRDIVKTIVDLCANMNLGCVAEGVETKNQMRVLRELGCHVAQGYLFSRPMEADLVPFWLLREAARIAATPAPVIPGQSVA